MSLNVLKDLRKIYAGLNADEIRGWAHHDLHVGLVALEEMDFQAMERFLAPPDMKDSDRSEVLRRIHRVNGGPTDEFDLVLRAPGLSSRSKGYTFDPAEPFVSAHAIAADRQDIELALARNFPRFRQPVADKIVQRVARENALFALVTALPNVLPSFIELPWAVGEFATDTAFLTMNQIRMALLLAAAYDQPVGYVEQKLQIGAIAAGAFGWRAIARELVGKIPLGGGLIPKAAVAFAGTYVVGLGLEKLNRTGSGLSKPEKRQAYSGAFARGKEIVSALVPQSVKRS
jgi:hypothetical protein